MDEWTLKLTKRIEIANVSNRFASALTVGERGNGKSMYNLKSMALTYYNLDEISESQAWLKALDSMIFSPYEYMKKIEDNYDDDKVDVVWCLDDAGVHFTGMMFFIDPNLYGLVGGSFDTIRTVTNALLLNVPFKKKLMGGLQQYDDREITISIEPGGNHNRKAICIKWYRLPNGKRMFYKDFEDHFSCYVPKWIYDKYLEKRRKYTKQIARRWRERMEKLNIDND